MKLSREQVEKLVRVSLDRLKGKELIEFKADEKKVFERMVDIFLSDLRKEDDLDKEVEALLKSHSGAMDSQRVDYRKMFGMIKNKLARERGMVL